MQQRTRNQRFRQHIDERGWTQDEVAKQVNAAYEAITGREGLYDVRSIAKLEHGEVSWPYPQYREALVKAFGVSSISELGFSPNRRRRRDSSGEVSEGVDASDRRQLIAAAAVAFGGQLDQPSAAIIEAADRSRVPGTVRAGDVRQLEQTANRLAAWDRQSGGGATRHMLLGALRWGLALQEGSCTPKVRVDLAATVSELADSAAWATFDAGLFDEARQLFVLGLHASRESGELGMRAHVATGFARQEIHAGNTDNALELVQLAQTATDVLTPNGISMLHQVKAMAYGRVGDADACIWHSRMSEDAYASDATDDPPWLRFYTPAKLSGDLAGAQFDLFITRSRSLPGNRLRLADRPPAELVEQFARTVSLYPDDRARSKPWRRRGWPSCCIFRTIPTARMLRPARR